LPVHTDLNNAEPQTDFNKQTRSNKPHSSSTKSASRLNKSFNGTPTTPTTAASKQQQDRPVRFDRATSAAKAYKAQQHSQQYSSLPVHRQSATPGKALHQQSLAFTNPNKRETHKDYLYSEDSIIVEEVPVLLPVIPNGVYHPGVMPVLMHPVVDPLLHHHPLYTAQLSTDSLPHVQPPAQPTTSIFYNPTLWTDEQIRDQVRHQIEYYFSDENLEKDLFLRKKMDILGYIPLSVIASFNRVKSLSQDFNQIVSALAHSQSLELTPVFDQATGKVIENYLVRCKVNPAKWPLANQQVPVDSLNPQLNPNVAEFVPSLPVTEATKPAVVVVEAKKSKPVTITKPSFERMLSSSVPDKEPSPWLTVQSKRDKLIQKKSSVSKTSVDDVIKEQKQSQQKQQTPASKDNREELDFMFDEEIGVSKSGKSLAAAVLLDSDSSSDESDLDCDEMDDQDISKLVIITQTPPVRRKASVHEKDHTGVHLPRSKITSDLAKAINDGLYFYEQDLNSKSSGGVEKNISLVSPEEFNKLKNEEDARKISIAIKTESADADRKHPGFGPSSLPANSDAPSFRQLMSHVNAIKSGAEKKAPQQSKTSARTSGRRDSCSQITSVTNGSEMIRKFNKKNERYSGEKYSGVLSLLKL